jgi:hypothetical protein
MIKILITGDRNWISPPLKDPEYKANHYMWMQRQRTIGTVLHNLKNELGVPFKDILIIQGGARGVDSVAGSLAQELGCQIRTYPAQWETYARAAGPIRNREMLDKNPDIIRCLAFHDDLGKSRGTLDMCRYALTKNVPVEVYSTDGTHYTFTGM